MLGGLPACPVRADADSKELLLPPSLIEDLGGGIITCVRADAESKRTPRANSCDRSRCFCRWVFLLSDAVLQCTVLFASTVGLARNVAGLTVLALGAQIPDLFASMSVARAGQGPSAVANAIGSQVINICIGMGLPFLIYAVANGHGITVKPSTTSV